MLGGYFGEVGGESRTESFFFIKKKGKMQLGNFV